MKLLDFIKKLFRKQEAVEPAAVKKPRAPRKTAIKTPVKKKK
jgi:hypothetical protein